jgi:hypothetical protein
VPTNKLHVHTDARNARATTPSSAVQCSIVYQGPVVAAKEQSGPHSDTRWPTQQVLFHTGLPIAHTPRLHSEHLWWQQEGYHLYYMEHTHTNLAPANMYMA